MAHLITLDELTQQITVMASVEETEAFFISVYLSHHNQQYEKSMAEQHKLVRHPGSREQPLDELALTQQSSIRLRASMERLE